MNSNKNRQGDIKWETITQFSFTNKRPENLPKQHILFSVHSNIEN